MLKKLLNRINEALDKHDAYLSFRNYTRADRKGEFPLHGRVNVSSYQTSDSVRLEWAIGESDTRFTVKSVPDEAKVGFRFAVPGLSLCFTLESYRKLGDLTKRIGNRQLRVAVHNGSIWWETPLVDPNCGSSDEPWYTRGCIPVLDWLFGELEIRTVKTERTTKIEVNLPEGAYTGVCELEHRLVGRSRWFNQKIGYAKIGLDAPHGIPVPGKGENDYDLDDDAIYMFSTQARTPADAVGQLVGRVLHLRWSRGGTSWRPAPPAPNDGGTGSGDDEPNIPSSTVPPSGTFTMPTIVRLPSFVLN